MARSVMKGIFYKLSRFKYNYFQKKIDNEWQKLYPDNEIFKDGILIYEKYYATKPKIMFLLKEPVDDFLIIREDPEQNYGPKGNSTRFWRHIRMWTYAIKECYNKRIPSFETARKIKEEKNNSIAYFNIKKIQTKDSDDIYSKKNDLFEFSKKHKKLLLKQISLINPKIIICGGSFCFFKKIIDNQIEDIDTKIYKYKRMILIDFYHPSTTGKSLKYEDYFNEIVEIMKKFTL
jgi:hypothetical protein